MRGLLIAIALITLTACGVQRPLMRPNEIPAYEEAQRKKRERLEADQRELEVIDAAEAAKNLQPKAAP